MYSPLSKSHSGTSSPKCVIPSYFHEKCFRISMMFFFLSLLSLYGEHATWREVKFLNIFAWFPCVTKNELSFFVRIEGNLAHIHAWNCWKLFCAFLTFHPCEHHAPIGCANFFQSRWRYVENGVFNRHKRAVLDGSFTAPYRVHGSAWL